MKRVDLLLLHHRVLLVLLRWVLPGHDGAVVGAAELRFACEHVAAHGGLLAGGRARDQR